MHGQGTDLRGMARACRNHRQRKDRKIDSLAELALRGRMNVINFSSWSYVKPGSEIAGRKIHVSSLSSIIPQAKGAIALLNQREQQKVLDMANKTNK